MAASLKVHRCRFVDNTPSAISSVAFPPLPPPNSPSAARPDTVRFAPFAVGRSNGNIEIYQWSGPSELSQSPQAWVITSVFPGTRSSKIDSLVFTLRHPWSPSVHDSLTLGDLRLFSTSGSDELSEWDLHAGTILRTISSQGGSIWSIAANPTSTLLALGCEDGAIRLISLTDNSFAHYRRFDRTKSRLLSLAWGPPVFVPPQRTSDDSDDDEPDISWTDSWLVAGCSDSRVVQWDFRTTRVINTMTTDKVRGEKTLVWAVGVLRDGTIVSGDSLGVVKFWDPVTATQVHTFQAHGADVLCLAVGSDGNSVYTSGVDQKVAEFLPVQLSDLSGSAVRWIRTVSRRLHSHDIRALAIWPPASLFNSSTTTSKEHSSNNVATVLVSGGLDMTVTLTPCSSLSSSSSKGHINPLATSVNCAFEDSYHRKMGFAYPSAVSSGAVQLARSKRVVLSRSDNGITLWKVSTVEDEIPWTKILEMELRAQTNLISSAISDDGSWLAVSDRYEAKLFRLSYFDDDTRVDVRRVKTLTDTLSSQVTTHSTLPNVSTGASAICFTPDSSKCVLATFTSSEIVVLDLNSEEIGILRAFPQHRVKRNGSQHAFGADGRLLKGLRAAQNISEDVVLKYSKGTSTRISCVCVSADGQWLASSDSQGRTHVFNLDGLQLHCSLPSYSHPVSTMSFNSAAPHLLLLGFPDNTLQVFDVEARLFPEDARNRCRQLSSNLVKFHDSLLGVTWETNPSDGRRGQRGQSGVVLLWGSNWIVRHDFAEQMEGVEANGNRSRRRKMSSETSKALIHKGQEEANGSFHVTTKFRQILLADFFVLGDVMIVERPLADILPSLSPPYFRQKYGS